MQSVYHRIEAVADAVDDRLRFFRLFTAFACMHTSIAVSAHAQQPLVVLSSSSDVAL